MRTSYFSFSSKIGRLEYFITQLFLAILSTIISIIAGLDKEFNQYNGAYYNPPITEGAAIFVLILLFVLLYFSVLTVCKRLNDLEKSKWLTLLCLIPIVNFVFGLYLLFAPGIKANQTIKFLSENESNTMDCAKSFNKSTDPLASPTRHVTNSDLVNNLERIATLRNKGLITEEEFQLLKSQLLDS